MKLGELATKLGAELRGDAELEVTGVKGIEEAGPAEITFVANPKYAGLARKTRAAAVLVEPEFPEIEAATLRLKNPYLAFSRALGFFYQPPAYAPGIHPTAVIDPTAVIGEGAHIGAYVVIGPRVKLGDSCHAAAPCGALSRRRGGQPFLCSCSRRGAGELHSGRPRDAGKWRHHRRRRLRLRQERAKATGRRFRSRGRCGWATAWTCRPTPRIDRATVGETRIGDGTKVDNLVQVGHASHVGENTLICAQTGLAGSSIIGNNVILAGQTGVAGHCTVGDGVILTAQSAVSHDVPAGKIISGSPGFDNRVWLRAVSHLPASAGAGQAAGPGGKEAGGPGASRRRGREREMRTYSRDFCSAALLRSCAAATPTTLIRRWKTAPAGRFNCLRWIIPAPASEPTAWRRARSCPIASSCAAAGR